jgi:DNA-binding NtrC family response regulator
MTAAPTDPLRVFLIEDDEDEYLLIRSLLAETHFTAYDLEWVATCDAALRQLTPWRHHVCLLDYRPAFRSGLDMLQEIKRGGCDVPVIVLSSHCDYEMEIGALRAGASDCLPKEQITAPLLERAIRYAIERKRTEQRIARGKKQLEYIFDAVPDCIAIIDSDHRFIRVNPAMARMLGKSPRDLIGKTCYRAVHRRSTPPVLASCPTA